MPGNPGGTHAPACSSMSMMICVSGTGLMGILSMSCCTRDDPDVDTLGEAPAMSTLCTISGHLMMIALSRIVMLVTPCSGTSIITGVLMTLGGIEASIDTTPTSMSILQGGEHTPDKMRDMICCTELPSIWLWYNYLYWYIDRTHEKGYTED